MLTINYFYSIISIQPNRKINMKKIIFIILSTFIFSASPSYSVEFGQDATGDPNAVNIGGSSGFLYSDRIVFAAAHLFDGSGTTYSTQQRIAYWETQGIVYAPGIIDKQNQKEYRVKKILIPSNYRSRVGNDQTRLNDFSILILEESVPMKNKVVVANAEDFELFVKEKTPVSMVGYGLQNPSQRTSTQSGNFTPKKLTSYLVNNQELQNYYNLNIQRISSGQTALDYGIPNSEKFGSICDGDSGSGFFVEKANIRYYLGAAGGQQWGIPNCQNNNLATFGIGGGMSGITATYKFLSLIKEAENIVAEDKRKEFLKAEEVRIAAELKAKQEAEAEAKAIAEAAIAKAEQEAKAAAELKAKQETEAKAAAEAQAKLKAELEAAKANAIIAAKNVYSGKSCTKLNRTTTVMELVKFTCIKKGKKLIWNGGVVINN